MQAICFVCIFLLVSFTNPIMCQNNSNCCTGCCNGAWCWHSKSSISSNCLSVMRMIPTFPYSGNIAFTRLMCTSAFSVLGQCRKYILNWNIVNPSANKFLRKSAEAFRSFFVSVGKSKNTNTHIILYSLNLSIYQTSASVRTRLHITNRDI